VAEHVVPVRVYLTVFAVLMALTATTTAIAFLDLGPLNAVLMLAIAGVKATLVVLYFMHVRWSSRLTWIVASGGFLWLAILIAITASDMVLRTTARPELSLTVVPPAEAFHAGPPTP
jgi:cytochrome c oxidase subunit 4